MLTVSVALVLFAVSLLFVQFLKLQWIRRQFPPGPTPYPFFGNLLQMNFQIHHEFLKKMAKAHGDVFTLWLSNIPVIVLQGFQAVKEGLTAHAEEVAGRPTSVVFDLWTGGNGVMFSNGHLWKQQRRFGTVTMRKMGVGKKDQEYRLQEEAHQLVEYLQKTNGEPLDPTMHVVHAVANVICAVIFRHRFSIEDEHFQRLIKATDDIIAFGNSIFFFVRKIIICVYADATYDEENLSQTILDLFLAGVETTATTLRWALLYMVVYPDIQEKVQKELDTVLGRSHLICYEDRKKVPYTNAVIHEIQRYSNIILIALPRKSVKDTELLGFHIPKDTAILSNIDSVLSDPEKWETPHQFNPGHFLDEDGNFVNREAFLPFSIGHRVCMGELLARMELFIVFSTLLQAFRFILPEGVKEVNTKFVFGTTMKPAPHQLCAIPR
uniref:Cytochrome P450 2J6-like n=1 Tax=Apteryx owenii TaxID=8824 RepID=A0A8B9QKC5_APTOW